MDARTAQTVDACRAADLLLGAGRVGHELDRRPPAGAGRGGARVTLVERAAADGASPAAGPARVALRFEPSGTAVRVPPGVTVFDAASWNGIAIDSTCGGHGTCKKCRVRIDGGRACRLARSTRARSAPEELDAGLAARLPGAGAAATS